MLVRRVKRTEDTDVVPDDLVRLDMERPIASFPLGSSEVESASCNTNSRQTAKQALSYSTSSCSGCFTSPCKKEGTDLLIFFRWSGSENEDEEFDGIVDTEGKSRINKSHCASNIFRLA